MKKLSLFIVLLLLCGCASVNSDINASLDNYLKDLSKTFNVRANHSAKYYEYYMPSDMQDVDGNHNFSYMEYEGAKITMNLNIASLVSSEAFGDDYLDDEGFFNESLLIYNNIGTFIKNDTSTSNYRINVYQNGDDYLIDLSTKELDFYSLCKDYNLLDTLKHLFTIAKSVKVDSDSVIANYSKKDIIESQKEYRDLFEYNIPSSGFLSDLVGQNVTPSDNTESIEENEDINEEIDEEVDEEGLEE